MSPETEYMYKLSRYQRAIGGITGEQAEKESPLWVNFTLECIEIENNLRNQQAED